MILLREFLAERQSNKWTNEQMNKWRLNQCDFIYFMQAVQIGNNMVRPWKSMKQLESRCKVFNVDSAFIISISLLVSQNGHVGQDSQGDQDGQGGQGNEGDLLVIWSDLVLKYSQDYLVS